MNEVGKFYTIKGYQLNERVDLTCAMEDYLEMICRIFDKSKRVRVSDLSRELHVKPSSVSKMIHHLNSLGYINSEKYGDIFLTEKGKKAGGYLLYRHNVIHAFLCALNNSKNELEEAEKIEHFLRPSTIENLNKLTKHIKENHNWKT